MTAEEILKKLVSFDTTSHKSNLEMIEWIEQYLDSYGVWHERVQEHNEDGTEKTSLVARIGPEVPGGIVLSGHTDVVPVVGQKWAEGRGEDTAFTMTERDGKLYGRGTADMKGFLALALAQVPTWQKQDLKKPVWLAFSHDEEVGCKCAEPMAEEFLKRNIQPQLVIVGEPTEMEVKDEHKGIAGFETIVTGKEGHSSAPENGVNAAYIAARLALVLEEFNAEERANARGDSRYPTPHTTWHLGVSHAGTQRNIIPGNADMRWEIRPLPGVDMEACRKKFDARAQEIAAQYPGCKIETIALTHVHGLEAKGSDVPHIALAKYLAGTNKDPKAVSYGTEGGAFGHAGFPTVICGPGSIDQAHGPDEFIAQTELAKGAGMMGRVGDVLAQGKWVTSTIGTREGRSIP